MGEARSEVTYDQMFGPAIETGSVPTHTPPRVPEPANQYASLIPCCVCVRSVYVCVRCVCVMCVCAVCVCDVCVRERERERV